MDACARRDPFAIAWGEMDAWRGSAHQAAIMAGWSQDLMEWAPAQAVGTARAIGQSRALRLHLLEQIDLITPKLRLPGLHKALSALRCGRRGPRAWRRYWLNRAVAYSAILAEERNQIAAARAQIASWARALDLAQAALAQAAQKPWPEGIPELAMSDHQALLADVRECQAALGELQKGVAGLLSGAERLRRKTECVIEAGHAAPVEESDVLASPWIGDISRKALAMPTSGVIGSVE